MQPPRSKVLEVAALVELL